jgi:3-ketoacyl-CoA synthase
MAIGVVVVQLAVTLYRMRFDLQQFVQTEVPIIEVHRIALTDLGWQFFILLALVIFVLSRTEKAVYLVDFSCFEPPESWRITYEELMRALELQNCYTQESLDFMKRMLERSGCGPRTAWPPAIMEVLADSSKTMKTGTEEAREESRIVMNDCVKHVLEANNVNPKDIDILIVNCSLFSPTPSLCAMIINDFNMRSDILSYNLSGMGCSAGIISIDLAKRLMLGRPNTLALVVSTENLTQALYRGNDRAFLMQNILFRVGGAAILMSNRWGDALRSQFKLLTSVRTQYVTEESVGCVYDTEDAEGKHGVRLSKDIVKVAGRALEKNFTALGPHVLPLSEQFKVVVSMIWKFVAKKLGKKAEMYIPDFKRGVHYFCIHAGGRGVIDGIEKNLNLSPHHVAASRHALYT